MYFTNANLANCRFIGCNIKTTDFREANLTGATITDCLVEATRYKGAILTNFTFVHNFCHGNTVGQAFIDGMIAYEEMFEISSL